MFIRISIVFALLIFTSTAFCAGGPVQPDPADVSTGCNNPHLHPWYTDDVTWISTTPLPQYQYRTANGTLGNYFYLFGEQNNPFANAYNITTEQWEPSTEPPLGNCNWCGVATDDAFYIVGRYDGNYRDEVQKFVPTGGGPTGTWSQVADYPLELCSAAAAWDGGDYIYSAGGGGLSGIVSNAYKYSISSDTWTEIASMPHQMKYAGGWYACGKFLVYSGIEAGYANALFVYDPDSDTWSVGASSPEEVWFATFNTTGTDQLMIVAGGGGGYDLDPPPLDAVQIYDPATNTWSFETSMPSAMALNSVGYLGNGQIISAGGYPATYTCYKGSGFPVGSDPQAPAAPSDFTVSHNNTALIATLDWVNPSLTAAGNPLTDLDGVKILRNGELIADLTDVVIGAPYSYDDATVPLVGMYNYSIIPYNDFGDGITAFNNVWIGLDVPGAPQNVTSEQMDLEVGITWNDPTGSAHGGYFPPGSWDGQKVYRNGYLIATLNGNNDSYTDEPGLTGYYEYSVVYFNASGDGDQGFAPQLLFTGIPQYYCSEILSEWVDISTIGTNTGIHEETTVAGPFPIGFDFPYYGGEIYHEIWISSNGWFSFEPYTLSYFNNEPIPDPSNPNNIIAPFWENLSMSVGGDVYYYYQQAQNRFIVSFVGIPYANGRAVDAQAHLYEDGTIDIMFGTVAGYVDECTVGIENWEGSEGVQATYNGSGPFNPSSNYGIRFSCDPSPVGGITLTPLGSTTIPANGGVLNFDITVENPEPVSITIDIWTMVTLPDSSIFGPIINVNHTFSPAQVITRNRNQNVPASAPTGNYIYHGYIGYYPLMIFDEDHFEFEKTAVDNGGKIYPDWENWGESFESSTEELEILNFELPNFNCYPNPFNSSTAISYKLQAASYIELKVYDIMGREVAKLVDGLQSAGSHNITFDGSNLASGIYFARLQAGEFVKTQKLLLMK